MKKTILITAIFSLLLNIGLIYLFIIKGETVKAEDGRTEITMSKANKAFVLTEMRDFLESVKLINEGIMTDNPNLIIKAGKRSGGSVIDHAPKGMLKSLPINFKSLGFGTHSIFDKFAATSIRNFDKKKSQEQLNTLLVNCTACHKAYKIETLKTK